MSLASLALGCRMRGLSQNAIFVGDVAEGRDDDPPGAGLADHLAEDLRKGGRAVSKPQNWRDSGWTFVVKVDGVEEEIVVARAPSGGWVVQVAPANSGDGANQAGAEWQFDRSVPLRSERRRPGARRLEGRTSRWPRVPRALALSAAQPVATAADADSPRD